MVNLRYQVDRTVTSYEQKCGNISNRRGSPTETSSTSTRASAMFTPPVHRSIISSDIGVLWYSDWTPITQAITCYLMHLMPTPIAPPLLSWTLPNMRRTSLVNGQRPHPKVRWTHITLPRPRYSLQGAHSPLYVLVSGDVSVEMASPDGSIQKVYQPQPGEML